MNWLIPQQYITKYQVIIIDNWPCHICPWSRFGNCPMNDITEVSSMHRAISNHNNHSDRTSILARITHCNQFSMDTIALNITLDIGVNSPWLNLTHWPLRDLREIFREVIFKLILVIDGWGISCEIVLTWTPQDLIDNKSTLVQVMAWCCQATSQYLSQCWHGSLTPYGIIRPQWVNKYATNISTIRLIFFGKETLVLR